MHVTSNNGMAVVLVLVSTVLIFSTNNGGNVSAKVFPVPQSEGISYWRTIAEQRLKKLAKDNEPTAKNVILFIGDGMGMATVTASRIQKGQRQGNSGEESMLSFDNFPNIGLAKTYNTDKQVPDSAGTATALFTGVKTRYGVIGLDHNYNRLSSIMDWAAAGGKRTGFVTTTRVTHATPAALYANTRERDWECDADMPADVRSVKDIARQLVEDMPGKSFNVILAGGRDTMGADNTAAGNNTKEFKGKFSETCRRKDGRNLAQEWLKRGDGRDVRRYVTNTEQLLAIDGSKVDRLLGLFAPNHLPFNVVRSRTPTGEPSIAEMTRQAISVLTRPKTPGFVLMIEGGRIDQAHHQNHAQLALDEVLAMDEAIEVALNMTDRSETLVIVTADHSHAVTMNGYPVRGNDILGFANKSGIAPYETITYANGPGFWKHRLNASDSEDGMAGTWRRVENFTEEERADPTYQHMATFPLEDETHGGEDVPIYSMGPGSYLLRGVMEQHLIGHVISFSACIGPTAHLNHGCSQKKGTKNGAMSHNAIGGHTQLPFIFTLGTIIVAMLRF